MRAVWLSSTYYLDDAVQKLSANAERMLTRALAHCGNAESSGYVSEAAIKMLGLPNPRKLVTELVDARIFVQRPGGGWDFRSWESWNSAGDALIARRKADRDRQARLRAARQGNTGPASRDTADRRDANDRTYSSVEPEKSGEKTASTSNPQSMAPQGETRSDQAKREPTSRETSRDVTPTEESRGEENSGYVPESATDSNGRGGAAATIGAELLHQAGIDPDLPVAAELRKIATDLVKSGRTAPADVVEGLVEWNSRTGIGPGVLKSLISDVVKRRNGHARAAPNGSSRPTDKLRVLAELAAEERALEQAQLVSAREELT